MDSQAFCNLCKLDYPALTPLFSNRPLHKGTEATLLVCCHCIDSIHSDDFVMTLDAQCHWCGNSHQEMAKKSDLYICKHCVQTCRSLNNQN